MKKGKGIIFIGIGFELMVAVLGGLFVGQKIDKYMSTKGVFTILLMIMGLLAWAIHFIVLIKKFSNENNGPEK